MADSNNVKTRYSVAKFLSQPAHTYVDNRLLLERWTTAQTAVLCRYLNGRFYDRVNEQYSGRWRIISID